MTLEEVSVKIHFHNVVLLSVLLGQLEGMDYVILFISHQVD